MMQNKIHTMPIYRLLELSPVKIEILMDLQSTVLYEVQSQLLDLLSFAIMFVFFSGPAAVINQMLSQKQLQS